MSYDEEHDVEERGVSEQRTMRERCEAIIADALEWQHEFSQGKTPTEPRSKQITDAILAELREPSFDMIEAAADQETAMLIPNRQGREDWSSEEIAEAMLRAAIDAIRGEGENAAAERPGQAPDDDAAR